MKPVTICIVNRETGEAILPLRSVYADSADTVITFERHQRKVLPYSAGRARLAVFDETARRRVAFYPRRSRALLLQNVARDHGVAVCDLKLERGVDGFLAGDIRNRCDHHVRLWDEVVALWERYTRYLRAADARAKMHTAINHVEGVGLVASAGNTVHVVAPDVAQPHGLGRHYRGEFLVAWGNTWREVVEDLQRQQAHVDALVGAE